MNNTAIKTSSLVLCLILGLQLSSFSQGLLPSGRVWGNFQFDAQLYQSDPDIGAPEVPESILNNGFANLNFAYQNLTIGMRYESYQNPMLGFDPRYRGSGIPYRFANWSQDNLDITVGNFYEQYGNGLVLRSYVDHNLGLDNAFDGIRLLYRPIEGISLRTMVGSQRLYFDKGPGIVRAADAEFDLNQLWEPMRNSENNLMLGISGVSKFQRDQDPIYILPENVAAFAGRASFSRKGINLNTEYAWKVNDPSAENNFIYRHGEAILVNGSYSQKGFGLLLSAKRIDNMSFRSNRNASANDLHINYLPALTRQHVYSLSGMYPYATQPNGEIGFLSELTFRIPRRTTWGGPYGTTIVLNYSLANALHKNTVSDTTAIGQSGTLGYDSDFFSLGEERYFQDANIELSRRFSRNFRGTFSYVNLFYNQNVIEGYTDKENVYAHIFIADMTYRLPARRSLKAEIQHLSTEQDRGNWAMLTLELNLSPNWFVAVSDQYNYGNPNLEEQLHYYNISAGYNKNANRFSLGWGRQREGVICVGGVCRVVPASSGFRLSVSSSF